MRFLALCTRLSIAAATAGAIACGEPAQAPEFERSAPIALALAWPTTADAVFGASIDSVDVTVSRRNESTALQTVIPFPAREEGLRVTIDVPLEQKVETLYVYIGLRAGQSTLYNSYGQVVLRVGTVPAAPALPLEYVGPGSDAAFVNISPRTAFVLPGGTLQFSATVQNTSQAIVAAPIAWSVNDTRLATISPGGLLTARSVSGSVRVRALTPTGVADSIDVLISTQLP
jgi:hypothetical protein